MEEDIILKSISEIDPEPLVPLNKSQTVGKKKEDRIVQ